MSKKSLLLSIPFLALIFSGCNGNNNNNNNNNNTTVVNSVVVTPSNLTLSVGSSYTLTSLVSVTNFGSKEVVWSTTNPSVASVTAEGLVTAYSVGTATITAISSLDPDKSGTCFITVNDDTPACNHEDVNPKDHKCDICGLTLSVHDDTNKDHNCDYCGERLSEHSDENKDGICDYCNQNIDKDDMARKFNELVSNIQTNHNYTATIATVIEGWDDADNYYDTIKNFNNKCLMADDFTYGLDGYGYILQKNQGFIGFYLNGETVVPTDEFVSTNPDLGITDFAEVTIENLLAGRFVQSPINTKSFACTDMNAIAVGCNLSGFGEYSTVGVLQSPASMTVTLDPEKDELTVALDFWLNYFDVTYHTDQGTCTVTIKNIGTTSNSAIESYIDNPSYTFVAPTKWDDTTISYFNRLYHETIPTFPVGLSYACRVLDNYYDGFERVIVEDMNSGDLRTSYGSVLSSEGYTKVSDNEYKKVISGEGVTQTVTYSVIMKYTQPSTYFPKGGMVIAFRARTDVSTFSSIETFNNYFINNKYDELVPLLPSEPSCTQITNFKDQTFASSETCCLKINSTDTFKVYISDFAKASAFVSSYTSALIAKGFSSTSKMLSKTNYALASSSSGSYVGVDFSASELLYPGYIGINMVIYKEDEETLRPEEVLYTVSASANIENGSIDFGGTTKYEAGSTVEFTISPDSGYEFESASVVGTDIKVSVNGNKGSFIMPESDVVVLVTFKESSSTPTYAINFSCEHFTVDHFEDESGNRITTYTYKEGAYGIFAYGNYDEGYDFKSGSVEGDSEAQFGHWYDDDLDLDVIQIYVTKQLDEYNISVLTEITSTAYTVAVDSSMANGTIRNITVNGESSTRAVAGDSVRFTVSAAENYSIVADSIKVKDATGALVAITLAPMSQSTYTFTMPASNVTIYAEFESNTPEPTKYAINKASLEGATISIAGMIRESEAGEYIRFTVKLDEGYTLSGLPFIVDHPEVEVTSSINPMTMAVTYQFEMPAHDVTISANIVSSAPASTYTVSADSSVVNGSISFTKTSYSEGEKVEFSVTPNSGYELDTLSSNPSVTITDDGDGNYSFTMPASNVVISATFKAKTTPGPVSNVTQYHVAKKNAGYDLVIDIYLNTDSTGSFVATRSDGYEAKYYFTWSTTDNANYSIVQDASKASNETCTFTSGNWQLYQNNTTPKSNTFTVDTKGVLTIKLYKSGMSTSTTHTLNLVTE